MPLFTDKNVQPFVLYNEDGTPVLANQSPTLPAGTDRSGSITTANASQSLAAANTGRKYLGIQNNSTGDLWVDEMGRAAVLASPSYRIAAGGTLNVRTNRAITVIGATAGQAWTATEY